MIKNRIDILKKKLSQYNIDGYIIPKNDEFFSEYAANDRLKNISNFTGSAGMAVVLKKKNYLFVDGRYTIQAKKESSKYFQIIEIHKKLPGAVIKDFTLGFDPQLFTTKILKRYFLNKNKLISIDNNLIDEIYKKKFNKNITKPFFSLNQDIVGQSHRSKIEQISKFLKFNKSDYLFISAPENVAWILNIRGYDNPNSPIPNCRLIIGKNNELFLIAEKDNTRKIIKENKIRKKQLIYPNYFENLINKLKGGNFIVDNQSCSIFFEKIISSKFNILNANDPTYKFKSIKNAHEIKHMIETHKKDGLALTRFIYWIKNNKKDNLTEIDAQNKLEKFRKLNKDYLYPSFNTIAGTGSNGAIVHYRATNKSSKIIKKNQLFLCDSGGQYKYGTTDVTRTICFSKQKKSIKNIFTKVLKGHIAVALTNLKKDKTGKQIDLKARKFLKKDGLDYAHGTGHGVGFFLNVHEGPQSISRYNSIIIQKGMVLSNEPGFYKKGKFGIRIENLVFAKQNKKRLYFENLTLAPIEKDLINYKLLNKNEKNYLFRYHLSIYAQHSKFLNSKERKWLASLI
ncbi:aminopeptidase P family protein [Candidatus Pelagibacter sp.]|nr:aminopeptidase P family protein [Candidatus Pelagibacter sp.]